MINNGYDPILLNKNDDFRHGPMAINGPPWPLGHLKQLRVGLKVVEEQCMALALGIQLPKGLWTSPVSPSAGVEKKLSSKVWCG